MNLVRAELSRLAARRFVQLMVILLLGAFAITVATTLISSHQPTAAEYAEAERAASQERTNLERWRADCEAAQRPDTPIEVRRQYPSDCSGIRPDQVTVESQLWQVFIFEREIRPLMMFLAAFLALFGFLVAASFIGAELVSGGMTNLLLWRPQRAAVLGAKLGTLLGAVLVLSTAATLLYVGTFWVLAHTTGLTGHVTAAEWGSLVLLAVRGLALTLIATALGFAVATLGRHTAAALGVVAAYTVVWEAGARIVMEIIDVGRPEQWMLSSYLAAWMNGRLQLWDRDACAGGSIGFCDETYTINWTHAGAVFVVLLALFVGGAFAVFRRRDLA
jgi:hypothetical protein